MPVHAAERPPTWEGNCMTGPDVDDAARETALDRPAPRPRLLRRGPVPPLRTATGRGPGGPQRRRWGCWVVSRHAEVVAVSARPRDVLLVEGDHDLRDRRRVPEPADHDAHRSAGPHPLPGAGPTRVPPDVHACARGRHPPSRPAPWSHRIEPDVRSTWSADLAVPLPLQVISDLLGVPEEEWPRFFRWSEAVIPGATDWPEEERARLSGEMVTYLLGRSRRPAGRAPGRHHLGAGGGRGRRGPAHRCRARNVPGAAAGGRERDDPQHDVRRPRRLRRRRGAVGGPGRPGRARGAPGPPVGRRGDAALDHTGGGLHADHHPRRSNWAAVSSAPASRS